MKRLKKFVFPDPDDRTKNDPCVIVLNQRVIGIYNHGHNNDEKIHKVNQKVQDWFKEKAINNGWDNVRFSGGQCILENEFKK